MKIKINKSHFGYQLFIFFCLLKYSFLLSFSLLCTVDLHLARSFASNSLNQFLYLSFLGRAFIRPCNVILDNLGCICQRPTFHTTETLCNFLNFGHPKLLQLNEWNYLSPYKCNYLFLCPMMRLMQHLS